MAKDPTSVAQDWANKLGAAGPKVQAGVEAVRTAPGAAAARQVNVWQQNTQAAAQKYARNVAAVSLSDWQQALVNKGIPRLGSGASAAQPKFAAFLTRLLPYVESAKASLPPRGTFDQNKARMNAMVDKMHQFSKS
jgi:hypothetical protein